MWQAFRRPSDVTYANVPAAFLVFWWSMSRGMFFVQGPSELTTELSASHHDWEDAGAPCPVSGLWLGANEASEIAHRAHFTRSRMHHSDWTIIWGGLI
jgi:hypothetical protein